MEKALKVGIIGAGHRSICYAEYALREPEKMKIVAVADPNEYRRIQTAERFGIPAENCFTDAASMAAARPDMDAVINGTMDALHIPTTLPMLEAGYDVLLEKPICTSREDLALLSRTAKQHGRKLMICHVLRYAPFYVEIKKRILAGDIGDIVSIQTEENVSYHHMAVGFIRGKWASKKVCGNPILMSKCCHDLDIISWLKSGINPLRVGSFGGLKQFMPENAPAGSGRRCLVDCKIERDCPYSAMKNYIEQGLWDIYAWESIEHFGELTDQIKIESLKRDNPYGRCVWQCENDVADHQVVMIDFEDGTTACHSLNCATPKPCRTIHITGTKGEISGVMEDGYFVLRKPDAVKGFEYSEERVSIDVKGEGHGGGDQRLVEDFVRYMSGGKPSISSTTLEDSLNGHLIAYAADEAMESRRIVEI